MEWAIMVVAIVLITTIGQIYRAKHGIGKDRRGHDVALGKPDSTRMREEIKTLKERIAVLERLATDTNRSVDLDREIEQLRSGDRV